LASKEFGDQTDEMVLRVRWVGIQARAAAAQRMCEPAQLALLMNVF
jgi:hypothetical protein